MIMINAFDNTITKGMLQAEKKILKTRLTHPWSPTLTVAILTLSPWKAKLSALRNHRDNSHVVTKILQKIKKFPGQPIPIQTDSNESKTIYSNFYDAKKYLKNTKKNAQQIRQEHLQIRSYEAACIGNYKLERYIRTLIYIENQIQIHKQLGSYVKKNQMSSMSQIDIPTDPNINWNCTPKDYPSIINGKL